MRILSDPFELEPILYQSYAHPSNVVTYICTRCYATKNLQRESCLSAGFRYVVRGCSCAHLARHSFVLNQSDHSEHALDGKMFMVGVADVSIEQFAFMTTSSAKTHKTGLSRNCCPQTRICDCFELRDTHILSCCGISVSQIIRMQRGHMTTEPNKIAISLCSKLEAIEETNTKAVDPIKDERIPDGVSTFVHYPKITDTSFKVGDDFPSFPPLTSFWRGLSDQFVREHIRDTDKNEKEVPAVIDATPDLDKTSENDMDQRSTQVLFDAESEHSTQALFAENILADGDFLKYSTNSLVGSNASEPNESPYLDPELVRRAHSFHGIPYDIPRFVTVPSKDSLRDAPEQVSIHGRREKVQNGLVEVKPGKFVRVHGIKHAQDAIDQGKSAVVECSLCSKRYAVHQSAKALYCTACDSVTDMRHDSRGQQRAWWHSV
jgi:hypothetical protein